ncbi:uncharacterized protein LOC128896597 [Hylaeus anthracinus]|uniref:uncharacterized protein LOC128896597 n=1 Tax=Hylaeus anthracinus TaxID=313031 RepID=UPI0023B97596|nr:uncharacterized protein LOC128896597 [Hylaeus anthracinus]
MSRAIISDVDSIASDSEDGERTDTSSDDNIILTHQTKRLRIENLTGRVGRRSGGERERDTTPAGVLFPRAGKPPLIDPFNPYSTRRRSIGSTFKRFEERNGVQWVRITGDSWRYPCSYVPPRFSLFTVRYSVGMILKRYYITNFVR